MSRNEAMSRAGPADGERQGFDSLPPELQKDIILRVLRADDVRSSAAALLLVSRSWSDMVEPDRCVLTLFPPDVDIRKFVASASMLDAEVRRRDFVRDDQQQEHADHQLTTAFKRWKHIRCLHLRRLCLKGTRCLESLRAASLRACMLDGVDFVYLSSLAALGAALHAAIALEHLAVIDCSLTIEEDEDEYEDLAAHLLAPLQLCASLRVLVLQLSRCLHLASLPQLTHFQWTSGEEYHELGTTLVDLGSSLVSLTLHPDLEEAPGFVDAESECLARMLSHNSTIRNLELAAIEFTPELLDAVCSMRALTRYISECDDPFYIPRDRAGDHVEPFGPALTELSLYLRDWRTLLLPPLLTSLVLRFDADDGRPSLQTLVSIGQSTALRRLRLAGLDMSCVQHHVVCYSASWADGYSPFYSMHEERLQPYDSVVRGLRAWAKGVDNQALGAQFFCSYVFRALGQLTELELVTGEWSEEDRAQLQAAAACPISWVCEQTAFTQSVAGLPEHFRRRAAT